MLARRLLPPAALLSLLMLPAPAAAGSGEEPGLPGPPHRQELLDPAKLSAPEPVPPLPAFHSTEALALAPEVALALNQLAGPGRSPLEDVRTARGPTPPVGSYQALFAVSTPAQIRKLLFHNDEGVRERMIYHIARHQPEDLALFGPLLRDETPLWHLTCFSATETKVAYVALDALCAQAAEPAARSVLTRAAADASLGMIRVESLHCVAPHEPAVAAAIAPGLLNDPDPTIRMRAVGALRLAGAREQLLNIAQLGSDPEPMVRAAVATALGGLGGGRETLMSLIEDPVWYVRSLAAAQYADLPDADDEVLGRLLSDPVASVRESVVIALAKPPGDLRLRLLGRLTRSNREVAQALALRDDPELVPIMRKLLKSRRYGVPEVAVRWLSEHGDRESLPRMRKLLIDGDRDTRIEAAAALARLGDRDAIPGLERVLRGDYHQTARIAAARALVALGSTGSLPVFDEADADLPPQAAAELRELASMLR